MERIPARSGTPRADCSCGRENTSRILREVTKAAPVCQGAAPNARDRGSGAIRGAMTLQQLVKGTAIATVTLSVAAGALWWISSAWRQWPRLARVDPSLRILHDPTRLLALAAVGDDLSMDSAPPGKYPAVETRHEALRALLALQEKRLERVLARTLPGGGGVDHVLVQPLPRIAPDRVWLLATPESHPHQVWARPGDSSPKTLWAAYVMEFDQGGRLLGLLPYDDNGKSALIPRQVRPQASPPRRRVHPPRPATLQDLSAGVRRPDPPLPEIACGRGWLLAQLGDARAPHRPEETRSAATCS